MALPVCLQPRLRSRRIKVALADKLAIVLRSYLNAVVPRTRGLCPYVHNKKKRDTCIKEEKITVCRYFKTNSCTRGDDCEFAHIHVRVVPEVKIGMIRIMNLLDDADPNALYNVLIDSGANEVVRPFNQGWWHEIINRRKGRMVNVGLAGGTTTKAAMTQYGEIMLRERGERNRSWIAPVSRQTLELGLNMVWTKDEVTLITASGKTLKAKIIGGLPFMTWEDFIDLRSGLIQSHLKGAQTILRE